MRDTGYFKPADPRGRWGKQNARWRGRGGGVQLTAAAALLAGAYGLSLAASDDSMWIADQSTPANNYDGTPGSKLTTTRASGAMYWNSSGVLTLAGNNELRRDFDPRLSATVERCGYLIEEARTNLALQSEDITTTWGQNATTRTANAAVAPDGATTADLITPTSANSNHFISQAITHTAASYTISAYVKPNGYTKCGFREQTSLGSYATFDCSGAGSVLHTTTATGVIVACANGWYRISVTFTGAATAQTMAFFVLDAAYTTGSPNSYSYIGDTVSGMYVWGFQDELGSFASSYIPTAGSTVTRAADLVTLAGTLFPLNTSEGTLYAKWMKQYAQAGNYIASLDNGALVERIALFASGGGTASFYIDDNSTPQLGNNGIQSTGTVAPFVQAKVAGGYKLNDCAYAHNGETVKSDNVCTMPTPTRLVIGAISVAGLQLNGWIFELAYLPTRFSNSRLQQQVSGYASDALLLMGAETQGLTFSATDQSMSILDTGTPANAYTGELSAKLGSIRTSAGMTYLSSGLLGWGPENRLLQSQTFNLAWGATAVTVVSDTISAPDGTLTADKLEETSANSNHFVSQSLALAAGVITHSVYAKAGERNWLGVYNATNGNTAFFDLANGVVGTTAFGTTAITAVGNGWYRCELRYSAASSGTIQLRYYVSNSDNNLSAYAGSTGSGLYLWGAQSEMAAVASTYKPTTSAAYYGLRLDYDSRLTGGPGYLVEEARTNLATQSQTFDNAAWGKSQVTVTADQGVAPDGTTTADLLVEAATTNVHFLNLGSVLTLTASTNYAMSVYAKQGTNRYLQLYFDDGANGPHITFDLQTGAVSEAGAAHGTGGSFVSSSITSVGSGWYRLELVGTVASGVADRCGFIMSNSATPGFAPSYAGNTANNVLIWGAQIELGAFATSYIPTTTASVTRAEDAPSMALAPAATSTITLVSAFNALSSPANSSVLQIDDGTGNNRCLIYTATTNPNGYCCAGGVDQFNSDLGTLAAVLSKNTIAVGFAANDFGGSHNGGAAVTDVSGSMPTGITTMRFGKDTGSSTFLNGWLRHGRYFPTRKSNADLAVLAAAA